MFWALCVLYCLFECRRTFHNCLTPEFFFYFIFFRLQRSLQRNLQCETMRRFYCAFLLVSHLQMSQPRANSTGPGKIIEPGHLVTPLHQTLLLHQNTFRCSDRMDQDIGVNWSIWLAEPGDWGHSAKLRGNKVSFCVTAPELGMLLRKCAANYWQSCIMLCLYSHYWHLMTFFTKRRHFEWMIQTDQNQRSVTLFFNHFWLHQLLKWLNNFLKQLKNRFNKNICHDQF